MSIPQRTRELRKALDDAQLFTLHIPGGKGYSHQLRVLTYNQSADTMILVERTRYAILEKDHNEIRLTEISNVVEKVRELLGIE